MSNRFLASVLTPCWIYFLVNDMIKGKDWWVVVLDVVFISVGFLMLSAKEKS